eukprot:TRINITY_DN2863_c0_g1_i2.p1 TRINITY_DN2863_c0_g1~~TRINITY_DN2863_c0_g1_i2.p1  ORF type:complete len:278 (+),score=41.35 TRINITY_DN2863_c0_g1_i2:58-834(+)
MTELDLHRTSFQSVMDEADTIYTSLSTPRASTMILSELKPYLIPESSIFLSPQPIGTGACGIVYEATWRGMRVAIKQLKVKNNEQAMKLQEECKIMTQISPHENVVQLLGLIDNPLSIVTEYCWYGSLDHYLYGQEPINMAKRIGILRDVAQGMIHLQDHKIVHRDLAARNCLLAEGFVAKVSDFGMSKLLLDDGGFYTKTVVGPIKWMAPEIFNKNKFSFETDVYSFGVLCIEVLTRDKPYPDIPMDIFTLTSYIPG